MINQSMLRAITLLAMTVVLSACEHQRIGIAEKIMARGLEQRMGQDVTADWADGLHLIVCGAGGPMPDDRRSGPCLAVKAGDTLIMIDAGTKGVRNLGQMGIPVGDIEAVLLTHFHSDHIDGLGEAGTLRWVSGANTSPLPVYGPQGVEQIVKGFNLAYAPDAVYRQAHHGDSVAPLSGKGLIARPFTVPSAGKSLVIFEANGLKISTFSVEHKPVFPAVAYRFDYKDRSLVISGDTAKSANLQTLSAGVDALVHEALADNLVNLMNESAKKKGIASMEKITFDILDYHTFPAEAAEIAQAIGAKHLLFYHVVPPLPVALIESAFLKGVSEAYDGDVTISIDGTLLSLPAGSDAVNIDQLL